MPEKLVEKISDAAERRGFLRKLSAASAALVLGLFNTRKSQASGVPCSPSLFKVACCCLFKDPRTCSYSSCACEWAWTCVESLGLTTLEGTEERGRARFTWDFGTCRLYRCRECYSTPETLSDGTCIGTVKCSKANFTTIPC